MAEYNAFLDIVKERPDWSIKKKPVCPFCKSNNISNEGTGTTLVGGKYNHLWTECDCKECNEHFIFEEKEMGKFKKSIRWYTKNRKVLSGIPGCFEGYIYTCSKCNGNVVRKYLRLDSDDELAVTTSGPDKNGVWFNNYRILFYCEQCGIKVESENDCYWHNPPKKMTYAEKVEAARIQKEKSEKFMKKIKIYEEIGCVVINDYAIVKVEVKE